MIFMSDNVKLPAISVAGAAFGLTASEFISEFVARATGQTGWKKFGVKFGIKGLLALIFYGIATRVSGLWSLGFEVATYGTLGSIVPDFFMAWNPGGLIGWAEKAAVKVRGASRGASEITRELAEIEAGIPASTGRF